LLGYTNLHKEDKSVHSPASHLYFRQAKKREKQQQRILGKEVKRQRPEVGKGEMRHGKQSG